jgi:hypothetical protein
VQKSPVLALEVALRSQQVIASKFWDKIFDCPEDERWATGGLLSDFNQGGCLNKCLEQALFVWTAIAFDLLTTAISVCALLGITYGVLSATISLWYIYCIARNAVPKPAHLLFAAAEVQMPHPQSILVNPGQ